MPKIKIYETYEPTVNVPEEELSVYVPILTSTAVETAIYRDVKSFVTAFPMGESATDGTIMAYNLIKSGYTVVAEGVVSGDTKSAERTKELSDKYLYDLRFLSSGDFPAAEGAMSTMQETIAEVATKRGDCVALTDASGKTKLSISPFGQSVNPEFVAMFYPECTMKVVTAATATTETQGTKLLPAHYAYLVAFISSLLKGNPEWMAVAGSVRGVIPGLVSVSTRLGSADVDALQCRTDELDGADDNKGCAVNPICNINPYGDIIWGNRTAKLNTGVLEATSFLNVRNLISTVKKTVFMAAKRYTFEQNDDILWLNFTSSITPTLDRMMSGSGIGGYKIIKQKTNKKARLKAKIQIIPIEAVEDFEIEVEIANAEL